MDNLIDSAIDAFTRSFKAKVYALLDGKILRIMSTRDRSELYAVARDLAFDELKAEHRFLKGAHDARIAQLSDGGGDGIQQTRPGTPEHIGAMLQAAYSRICKDIMAEQDGEGGIEGVARSGFAGIFEALAVQSDLLPPDRMLAELTGVKLGTVQGARSKARADGYDFEAVDLAPIGAATSEYGTWYRVIKRPPRYDPQIIEAANTLGVPVEALALWAQQYRN